jgi:homoserine kinase
MRILRETATVRVPATSANLGPAFDAMGLALGLHDTIEVRTTTGRTEVDVAGHGAGTLPTGEDHLVVQALRAGLHHAGAPQVGLRLRCTNRIPHGRGLGSSAAAVVGGLLAARGLVEDPGALDDDAVLALATQFEGHPDNAAPAVLGGATIAWVEPASGPRAVRIAVSPDLTPAVLVPDARLATSTARAVLPPRVPHADAAHNVGRAALLVVALAGRRDLLLPATEDRLHQAYRSDVMRPSLELLAALRAEGMPAVISGAGPSVLVLDGLTGGAEAMHARPGWAVIRPGVDREGATLLPERSPGDPRRYAAVSDG